MNDGRLLPQNRRTASLIASITFILSCGLGILYFFYLPIARERPIAAWSVAAVGVLLAWVLYFLVRKLPNRLWARTLAVLVFFFIITVPISSRWCQRINHARFGFTLYGAMPVPLLDLSIDADGWLLPRVKSHEIKREELERLAQKNPEVIIVALGWDSVSALNEEAQAFAETMDVREVSTEEAVQLYNQLKSEGVRVALLLHSTC